MSQALSSPSIITNLSCNNVIRLTEPATYNRNSNTSTQIPIDECLWALHYPELQKACYLARICSVKPPLQCQFLNIKGILQNGPTCGLTAIRMMLNGAVTLKQLLHDAQQKHYTNNGEMFSAKNLYQLISDHLAIIECNNTTITATETTATTITTTNLKNLCNIDNRKCNQHKIECQLYEGHLNSAKVKECLKHGACLFVPYDPDFNHAPCIKFGHKAHWALIIGYLISDEFYVLARHGKARNLAVWSLKALSDSNSNLMEFAQPKGYPNCDFLVPPGGIGGDLGLRERAIIVKNLPHEIINI